MKSEKYITQKYQEMEVLRDAIKKLGPESYLGPWLQKVMGEVERDIKSDFEPAASLSREIEEMKVQAEELRGGIAKLKEEFDKRRNDETLFWNSLRDWRNGVCDATAKLNTAIARRPNMELPQDYRQR